MKSLEIRQKFFDYFVRNGHTKVASSSLIPADDPTLLFANAGMNQFKDIFLGKTTRSYSRAVTIQKCIRAGGKHNDLDNVGRTARHLTFFEMLGNFSFGDYFKKDAISFAWEFLIKEIGFKPEQLWVSVYQEDSEAYEIWHNHIGIPAERIVKLGRKDNFWQMGDTGPCGPCSEIYVDRGAKDMTEKDLKPGDECERFLEIWNLVFMQFDRQKDGTEIPLKKTGIDTGMGLERICAVLQNTPTVFETDIFAELIKTIEKISGKSYQKADAETKTAFRVLLDHIRSTSLAIADGGMPSNEGRGYVIRKIIRRAALFAQKLGDITIFAQLVAPFAKEMGTIYPELITNKQLIESTISNELEKFSHNLTQGEAVMAKFLAESAITKKITGDQAFRLYDTYGFPLELTTIIAHQSGYVVDEDGFEKSMLKQQEQSGKKRDDTKKIELDPSVTTSFVGYDHTTIDAKIVALIVDGNSVEQVESGTPCLIVTDQTPFFAECGGQVSDHGTVSIGGKEVAVTEVKKFGQAVGIAIKTPAPITIGANIKLAISRDVRLDIARNHTATHLLQSALMKTLGSHVKQAGSLVTSEYARFDFTHNQPLSIEEIDAVEKLVNQEIRENKPVETSITTYKDAVTKGAIAFFGEKYNPENVRVVSIPGFSTELCGGTHVHMTGDIGTFKIIANISPAAGIRRITAVTGRTATDLFAQTLKQIHELSQIFKIQQEGIVAAVQKQQALVQDLTKQLTSTRRDLLRCQIPGWLAQTKNFGDIPFKYIDVPGLSAKELRDLAQELVTQKPGFYIVVSSTDTNTIFTALIAEKYANYIDLQEFVTWLNTLGIRGGRAGTAIQGGAQKIPEDFEKKIVEWGTKR